MFSVDSGTFVFVNQLCHLFPPSNLSFPFPVAATFGLVALRKTMAQSKFPIPPEKLVKRAKEVLAAEFGTKEGSTGNFLAEDFQFVTWEKWDSSQT